MMPTLTYNIIYVRTDAKFGREPAEGRGIFASFAGSMVPPLPSVSLIQRFAASADALLPHATIHNR